MKKTMLTKFKTILDAQKKELEEAIKNKRIDLDSHGDETDAIQAKIIQRSEAQLLARNQEKLLKTDFALKKIADGSFGTCEECSDEIAEKRLMFNPSINTCISCAESLERLRKSGAR